MKVITENRIEEIKKETGILLGKAIKETNVATIKLIAEAMEIPLEKLVATL